MNKYDTQLTKIFNCRSVRAAPGAIYQGSVGGEDHEAGLR